jgi:hypothetical protein
MEAISRAMVTSWQGVEVIATKKILSIAAVGTTCSVN